MSEAAGVLCLGLAVQDTILTLPAALAGPGKQYATGRRLVGGGPAATAAVAIARLGGRADLAARLGDDAVGDAIAAELAAEGVGTRWLRRFAGAASPSSTVLVDPAGERLIAVHAPPLPPGADWLAPDLSGLGAVLCDCTWPEGAARLLTAARTAGLPAVVDADVTRHDQDTMAGLVALASHVVFSRPGLARFAGTGDIADGLAAAARHVRGLLGVTDGAAGLYVWAGAGRGPERSLPPAVTAQDTTGAGDAFHGALALALANGWDDASAIRLAHGVAALKCTRPGGRAGLPDPAALAAFDPSLAPLLAPRSKMRSHDTAQPA